MRYPNEIAVTGTVCGEPIRASAVAQGPALDFAFPIQRQWEDIDPHPHLPSVIGILVVHDLFQHNAENIQQGQALFVRGSLRSVESGEKPGKILYEILGMELHRAERPPE